MNHLVLCVALSSLFFTIALCSVSITPKYDDDTGTVHFTIRHPIDLSCNVTTDEEVEVKWKKEDIGLEKITAINGRFKLGKNGASVYTLHIWHTVEDDSGNYSCVAYQKGQEVSSAKIAVASRIAVKIPTNINVVEGEKLRIHCNVVGKPFPKIHWHYENESKYEKDFDQSEGRIILEDDTERHIANAILRIDAVEMYDRGKFTCIGTSEINDEEVTSVCMIRIKDKYAALWPFLGICAEVLILCTIIFIYEKKRNKQELEDSDTDQGNDQKNTPDNGKEANLRHRQQQ